MAPLALYKTVTNSVAVGGEPVIAAYGPIAGGFITNPASAADQGLPLQEVLFVDITGPAVLEETETTIALQAGSSFVIPPGQTTNVSVNAASSGHLFSGVIYQPPTPFPPTPQPGTFPPSGPTTLTSLGGMMSFLYRQYADDDNLQSFVDAYNEIAGSYISWFALTLLPVYTSPLIVGTLLDWVAQGIYGIERPTLSSGVNRNIGPFNTYGFNALVVPFNHFKILGPTDVAVTTDDVFKRIITWNFYKGDGNVFSIPWLKRRVMRFLTAPDGTAPNIDQTYPISVLYGDGIITIALSAGSRKITGGALFNVMVYNHGAFNSLATVFEPVRTPLPLSSVLKEAIDSGVLLLPIQYDFVVVI